MENKLVLRNGKIYILFLWLSLGINILLLIASIFATFYKCSLFFFFTLVYVLYITISYTYLKIEVVDGKIKIRRLFKSYVVNLNEITDYVYKENINEREVMILYVKDKKIPIESDLKGFYKLENIILKEVVLNDKRYCSENE